jgi:flagellar basal body-associated protein FliL
MQQGAYMPPPQPGGYGYGVQPPKKRSRVGLIVGIVLLVVVLACVGISALVYNGIKQGVSSVTATVTASVATVTAIPNTPTGGQSTPPSGQSIDSTAAGIITNIQMASAVNQDTAVPTQLATTFTVQQTIYTTVDLKMNGQTGYTEAKWYADGAFVFTSKILAITDPTSAHAFFGATYKVATQGAVEVYFCTQSDCSDAKLADVANFTVTSSGLHWQSQPPIAMTDINRP